MGRQKLHVTALAHRPLKAVESSSDTTSILQREAHFVGAHGARVVKVKLSEDGLQGEKRPQSKSDAPQPLILWGRFIASMFRNNVSTAKSLSGY